MDAEELTQARSWPGHPGQYAVMQRDGIMYHLSGRGVQPTSVLNMQGELSHAFSENEYGFKSFDFHPDFEDNGMVFMGYTDDEKHSVIARFFADPSDPTATWTFGDQLIRVDYSTTPFHNVAELQFGPDGYLYITLGDPSGVRGAQYLDTFYGKMLRLNVDGTSGYTIPSDNPYVGRDDAAGEVFLYGLRNPWRFDFDVDGALWIADTGQSDYEEVNLFTAGSDRNFGWPYLEGHARFMDEGSVEKYAYTVETTQTPSDAVPPVAGYKHDDGCAIVGGVVYNGNQFPDLKGLYIVAEHCFSELRTVQDTGLMLDWFQLNGDRINSLDENAAGELLLTTRLGRLMLIEAA